MAKKSRSRRARSAAAARRRPSQAARSPQRAPAAPVSSSAAPRRREEVEPDRSPAASGGSVDFRSEYRYVLADLKRLGILAAAMFALLVVLSFII